MDKYAWLEKIHGKKALEFVNENNEKTINKLKKNSQFQNIKKIVKPLLESDERIPYSINHNGYMYNFWQDKTNVQGLWRRTSLTSFKRHKIDWEILLDLDILSKKDKIKWVWGGASFSHKKSDICLIHLSNGGKDSVVIREFNVKSKEFIKDGFNVPESKTDVTWLSDSELFIGSDFGKNSLTNSGYPRKIKLWKRGTDLKDSETVFQVKATDISASVIVDQEAELLFYYRQVSYYESELFLIKNGKSIKINCPKDSEYCGVFKNQLIFKLGSDLNSKIKSGSLVSLNLDKISENFEKNIQTIYSPNEKSSLSDVSQTNDYLILDTLDNIKSKIKVAQFVNNKWKIKTLIKESGMINVSDTIADSNTIFLCHYDFLTPETFSIMNLDSDNKATALKQSKHIFNSKNFLVKQEQVKSQDGTLIPYFVIHHKNTKLDSSNPTILYGYGGFQVSMTPFYLSLTGKLWLEKGGVYVLSNIRGGGEFGPEWHKAALKENRHKCFEDFTAIAEDLIKNKVTSPNHLGIKGGSNGGLLVGSVFLRRPDLFNAVVCQVPLLDMLNYNKLLAGASWMDEYGDPNDSKIRKKLLSYSPFHVKTDVKYPEVFFTTSTNDDRVHPAHARKMVKKMQEQGHQVLYYEAPEGGHTGASNVNQETLSIALEYSYLWKKLK
jgi:prolyl oligopeptidase